MKTYKELQADAEFQIKNLFKTPLPEVEAELFTKGFVAGYHARNEELGLTAFTYMLSSIDTLENHIKKLEDVIQEKNDQTFKENAPLLGADITIRNLRSKNREILGEYAEMLKNNRNENVQYHISGREYQKNLTKTIIEVHIKAITDWVNLHPALDEKMMEDISNLIENYQTTLSNVNL